MKIRGPDGKQSAGRVEDRGVRAVGGRRLAEGHGLAVKDAAAAIVESALRPGRDRWHVFDLVGPEAISYRALLDRLAARLRAHGRRAVLLSHEK